jgi:glycosyltransferase involved in cell wall biosynthesis
MRIAMLYTPLVTAGGAERQVLQELALLRQRGHQVDLLTFRLADEALFGGHVDVTVLSSRLGLFGKVFALRRALMRMAPDVLVSHTSPELTWLATRGTDVAYVMYHNSPPFYIGIAANPYMASSRYRRAFECVRHEVAGYGELGPLSAAPHRRAIAEARTWLKDRALRSARAVVVPSERTAHELRLLHGIDATVVRGCLPASLLERPRQRTLRETLAPNDEPLVLSVSRLEPQKRVDLLIRAFALLRHDVPDARLVIAGKGSEAGRIGALVRELGLIECVQLVGYVPDSELWDYYGAADVLAAPAMADFVIAPYEAMALGCKAVWTDENEADGSVLKSGQVFVAKPEPRAFANAIVNALRAPAARADLQHMTWEARADRIERVYGGASSERPAA